MIERPLIGLYRSALLGAVLLVAVGCGTPAGVPGVSSPTSPPPPAPRAEFVRQVEWAQTGVWLKADTHLHTRFSDGAFELGAVVDKGVAHGCDVLAITDHGDKELTATTEEYFAAIDQARQKHPSLVLIAGMEWNVPPWKGEEHATLLAPAIAGERKLLADFKTLFDDWKREGEQRDPDLALAALRWLADQGNAAGAKPLVIYNHPSRKRERSDAIAQELRRWRAVSHLAVGFEGSPGHQAKEALGAYKGAVQTIDRWDPAAATIGDAWDQLLAEGDDVWAAVAGSDFHHAGPPPDCYWPGEFSETWLFAPERSAAGALAALREGTFFGVHGHIAREVVLSVKAAGLDRPAIAGEAIRVPKGTSLEITLAMSVPPQDWEGASNRIDEIELIVITDQGAKSQFLGPPEAGPALRTTLTIASGQMAIRARGRRVVEEGPDLMFYTNPVRVISR